jgi:membrane-bound lytic murein transglycosylase A
MTSLFAKMEPVDFAALPGFGADDLGEAFAVFRRSAVRLCANLPEQRPALAAPAGLFAACRAALEGAGENDPAEFFSTWFRPFRLSGPGFVTAYYQPEIEARLEPSEAFSVPVLARPRDLVTLNDSPLAGPAGESLTAARRDACGALRPFPTRGEIEADPAHAHAAPLAYLRDAVELFLMQVQGSARLRLKDGRALALTYAGRNGWPYASIGRLAIKRGLVPAEAMSLAALKAALRRLGVGPGEAGRRLMQENRSYVFFRIDESCERRLGPIGGEGAVLTPLRSIAVDRSVWSYGLPFWIAGRFPWRNEAETEFARLTIAQDTGSAILGAARADLFYGSGARAGDLAGRVRHQASFAALLPRGAEGFF